MGAARLLGRVPLPLGLFLVPLVLGNSRSDLLSVCCHRYHLCWCMFCCRHGFPNCRWLTFTFESMYWSIHHIDKQVDNSFSTPFSSRTENYSFCRKNEPQTSDVSGGNVSFLAVILQFIAAILMQAELNYTARTKSHIWNVLGYTTFVLWVKMQSL